MWRGSKRVTGWSEEAFRARVTERCAELGRSKRSVLEAAGIAHDYLQTVPAHGRRVDNLEKLARALDWSLADIIGLSVPQISPENVLRAQRSAQRILEEIGERDDETKAWILAMMMNLFEDARQGYPDTYNRVERHVGYLEQKVVLALTDPDFAAEIERKVQRFQQIKLAPDTQAKPSNQLLPDKN